MVVAPGTGWPGDLATAATPVARAAADVRSLAAGADTMPETDARISVCRACPRLVAWREEVAATKRRAFALEPYWGRPVPGFGADRPQILVVGLAPAAHGANRTGRNFTGDRSGDFLYAALFRAGLANHPTSVHAGDGLALQRTRIVAAVRCAPPANLPTPVERDTCRLWLDRQLELAWSTVRAIVVLGGFGWSALWPSLRSLENGSIGGGSIGGGSIGGGSIGGGSIGGGSIGSGSIGSGSIGSGSIGSGLIRSGPVQVGVPARVPAFGHGVEVPLGGGVTVLGCYHVSQQNTFTGRLTEPMIDAIFARALEL